ncbi:hypothetical protein AAG906_029364 [Vitis piasezkii]
MGKRVLARLFGTFPNASSYKVMGSLVHMMDLCTCGNCLPVLSLAVYTISKVSWEIAVYLGEEWRRL